MRIPIPQPLRHLTNGEFDPPAWRSADIDALDGLSERLPSAARRVGLDLVSYAVDRRGQAATLRAIDTAAGGGFYDIPPDAELDKVVADATFAARIPGPVIDVQTHFNHHKRLHGSDTLTKFLRIVDPDRWSPGDVTQLFGAEWAGLIFGASETQIAVLSSQPGSREHGDSSGIQLSGREIAATREIIDRYAPSRRVLTHTAVNANVPHELDRMDGWATLLRPSGWKTYTSFDPPDASTPGGWFFDDEQYGIPFLKKVSELHRAGVGPRVVAVHKGLGLQSQGSPQPGGRDAKLSPRDIGPAARMFPDLTFLVYHAGYFPSYTRLEGAYSEHDREYGVNRLVASLLQADVGPGQNVYAEIGATWFLMMRRPHEAAHVLGKLLSALGEDRILWGTDCVYFGSPQPLIDAFRAFSIPEWMQAEFGYPPLTDVAKEKILGRNAIEVYDIDPADLEAAAADTAAQDWATAAGAGLLRDLTALAVGLPLG